MKAKRSRLVLVSVTTLVIGVIVNGLRDIVGHLDEFFVGKSRTMKFDPCDAQSTIIHRSNVCCMCAYTYCEQGRVSTDSTHA